MRYLIKAAVPVTLHVDDREQSPVRKVFVHDSVLNLPGLRVEVEAGEQLTQVVTRYDDNSPLGKEEAARVIRLAEDAGYWPAWQWE